MRMLEKALRAWLDSLGLEDEVACAAPLPEETRALLTTLDDRLVEVLRPTRRRARRRRATRSC